MSIVCSIFTPSGKHRIALVLISMAERPLSLDINKTMEIRRNTPGINMNHVHVVGIVFKLFY